MGSWIVTNKKKIAVHASIIAMFVLYAFFGAGPLFDRFEAIGGESKLLEISLPSETNNISLNVERVDVGPNQVEIEGWAFVQNEPYDDSQVYVVLGGSHTYVFDAGRIGRLDVIAAFPEHARLFGSADLHFAGFLSLIPMGNVKSGGYRVGIYIGRGGYEYLQYTDLVLAKSRNSVTVTRAISTLQRIALPVESANLRFYVESIRQGVIDSREIVEVVGWAFIEDESAGNSEIYVVLRSGGDVLVFSTMSQRRPDVTAYFAPSGLNLDGSGFIAKIPEDEIGDGAYELGIYIRKGDLEAVRYTGDLLEKAKLTPEQDG
jgi:hypothetical protein